MTKYVFLLKLLHILHFASGPHFLETGLDETGRCGRPRLTPPFSRRRFMHPGRLDSVVIRGGRIDFMGDFDGICGAG